MKVDQKGHTVSIKNTEGDFTAFLMKITHQYKTFQSSNIIIDLLSTSDLTMKQILQFKELAKQHKKSKKSFIIAVNSVDFNEVPEKLTVVPSLLEAHDIIAMEEIERDLGF